MKLESFTIEWVAPAEPVPSPCVGVCTLDDEQVCVGCSRTTEEIAAWPTLTDEEKRQVLDAIDARALGGS